MSQGSNPPGSRQKGSNPPGKTTRSTDSTPPEANQVWGTSRWSIGQSAALACLMESMAPKAGNVHRGADFVDTTFYDFLVSSMAIEKTFDCSRELTLGQLIRQAVAATAELVGTNTNLGIILLLAPLAQCRPHPDPESIRQVLDQSTAEDCRDLYAAIAIAQPGGLGKTEVADAKQDAPPADMSLVEAMRLASDRDSIAREYATYFDTFFQTVLPIVDSAIHELDSLPDAIVHAHLDILSRIPDTLITRKCGVDLANSCSARAARIVDGWAPGTAGYLQQLEEFDFWLRSDEHRRNPGTSADYVAAALFALLRTGRLPAEKIRAMLASARRQK